MRLVVDLNDEVYNNMVVKNEYTDRDVIAVHNALMVAIRIPEGNGEADVVDHVLQIIESFLEFRFYYGDCPMYHIWDINGLMNAVKALKVGERE